MVSLASYAVLALGWIKASKDLRQGYHSSFLFTIEDDVLRRMMLRVGGE